MTNNPIAPPGACATVSIINTAILGDLPAAPYFHPPVPGFSTLSVPSYSFLVTNPQGRKILFDLGVRKDWENLTPTALGEVENDGIRMRVEEDVLDVLERNGVTGEDVEAIVLSHHHFDHIGDPSRFPERTQLVVGPGFKEAFMPGYPDNVRSPILTSDYTSRKVTEVDFDTSHVVRFCNFRAVDYFGDGSFYILDAPGHTIDHICGLARTTNSPDTFILMGGDACHHNGEFRPSPLRPLPGSITPNPCTGSSIQPCPGKAFERYLRSVGRERSTPFFGIPRDPKYAEYCHNVDDAHDTISKVQGLDGLDNVLVIVAHDNSILDKIDFFPENVNSWMERGWGELSRWAFLKSFAGLAEEG